MVNASDLDYFDDDEEDERFFEEWRRVERHAAEMVQGALAGERGKAPPLAIADSAAAARSAIESRAYPVSWVARAAAMEGSPPEDGAELLVALAAAVIAPKEETGLDVEEESMLFSLELADWAGAVIELVREGPGAFARPRDFVAAVDRCPEIDGATDAGDLSLTEAAFSTVQLAWMGLGLVDRDQRLTEVGLWVLPRALTRAWHVDFDRG